jgi:hypothetical protein
MYKDTKGYKVIDTTLAEAVAKAVGFQPKSVAEIQEANSFMQRAKSFYSQTSSEIKAQWADALFRKDEGALARARTAGRLEPEQSGAAHRRQDARRVEEGARDGQGSDRPLRTTRPRRCVSRCGRWAADAR